MQQKRMKRLRYKDDLFRTIETDLMISIPIKNAVFLPGRKYQPWYRRKLCEVSVAEVINTNYVNDTVLNMTQDIIKSPELKIGKNDGFAGFNHSLILSGKLDKHLTIIQGVSNSIKNCRKNYTKSGRIDHELFHKTAKNSGIK